MAKRSPVALHVDNSVGNSVAVMAGRNGGKLRVGNPGNKGGRPPDAWKLECQEMASRDDMLATARRVLKDKDHPAWLGAWKFVAEQAYGKAPQPQEHRGGQTIEVIVRNESKQERAG